ncbi:MAG TPA: hypothetical protein VFO85_11590 [Vicinamibacteria bacterium]|nr:hypothetical protein [Vicinamibacteria bacterium]
MASLAAALSGCDPYRCLVQSRAQQFEAPIGSGPITGRAAFSLSQTRGAENDDFVMWHVRASPLPAPATRVTLREGTPDAPGRVLYEFPLVNAVADSGVITQVFTRTAYAGQVPFAELWDLVQRQPVSMEVVFTGDVPPLRVGPLSRTSSGDWQDVCT